MNTIHATAVALGESGILLRGASGAGKSDLALRLIADGAMLVADDQVALAVIGEALWAAPPAALAGLIELRGVGIRRLPHRHSVCLRLILDLAAPDAVERLPEPVEANLLGVRLPVLVLAPFEASAVGKIKLALKPGRSL